MTDVGGEDDLPRIRGFRRGNQQLPHRKRAVEEFRVDHHMVIPFGQGLQLPLSHAEAAAFLVIRGHVGDDLRIVLLRVNILLQLRERQHTVHGRGIAQHMQVVLPHVDHALPVRALDIGFAKPPFLRHRPVKDLRPRGHLKDRKLPSALRNLCIDPAERLAVAFPRQGTVQGKNGGREVIHPPPFFSCCRFVFLGHVVYFTTQPCCCIM